MARTIGRWWLPAMAALSLIAFPIHAQSSDAQAPAESETVSTEVEPAEEARDDEAPAAVTESEAKEAEEAGEAVREGGDATSTVSEPKRVEGTDAPPPQRANIFDQAIRMAQERTVKIYGAGIALEHGYATGTIISADGRILTAHGLYVTGDRIRVVLPNGQVHMAQVERQSEAAQIVLLKIDAQTPDYFPVLSRPIVDQGDWVLAVGNPFKVADGDEPMSVNLGVLSMRARVDTKRRAADMEILTDIYLIDAITSNPGAPGGALVTVDGRLAGVVGKMLESASTNTRINYAIPNDVIRQFLDGELDEEALAAEAQATRELDFGFELFRLPGPRAAAYVDRITRTGPARRAGLRRDDMILSINGEQVYTIRDYDRIVSRLNPEREAIFVIKRREGDHDALAVVRITPNPVEKEEQ
ncbi:MAG: serine protease [Phycisphaeraceae bacterium]|nr:serine protease [Phycisphaeraceae bacterium]